MKIEILSNYILDKNLQKFACLEIWLKIFCGINFAHKILHVYLHAYTLYKTVYIEIAPLRNVQTKKRYKFSYGNYCITGIETYLSSIR